MTNYEPEESKELSVEDIIQQFLTSLIAHGRSQNTIRNYRKFLLDFHAFLTTNVFNGDYRIEEVTAHELEQYFHYLKTEKHNSSKTKSPTTTSSGGLILALLRAMLLLAPEGGVASINTGPLTMRYLLNLLF